MENVSSIFKESGAPWASGAPSFCVTMAPGLVSYSMRATASYLYEGLVVTTLSETGADNGRASARCLRVGV